jgi:hypothetical protein
MLSAEATIRRIRNGLLHFAEVELHLESPSVVPGIEFHCAGEGWIRQGQIEDVPSTGYDDWKAGARIGVEFALSVVAAPPTRVLIDRISGLTTDTNPTIVGGAAALAVWKALAFSPPPDVLERLETVVFASWRLPAGAGVDFR